MNKTTDQMGFSIETSVEQGASRSMGEGTQAISTELGFSDMAKISGAAAIGAAVGEGMIVGIQYLVHGKYEPSAAHVEFKITDQDGNTVGGATVARKPLADEVKDYDKAADKKATKDAKKAEKAEKKEAKAAEKAEKKETKEAEKAEKKAAKDAEKNPPEGK